MRSHIIDVPYGEIGRVLGESRFRNRYASAISAPTSLVDTFLHDSDGAYRNDGAYGFNIVFEPQIELGATKLSIPENINPAADTLVMDYVSKKVGRPVRILEPANFR